MNKGTLSSLKVARARVNVVASRSMVLGVHVGSLREMAVSADGARLATSGGFEVDLWDVAEGKVVSRGPAAGAER